jgi:hypothetical protein
MPGLRAMSFGISKRRLRFSVGLEGPEDHWSDLDHAVRSTRRTNVTTTDSALSHGGLIGALHVAGPAGDTAEKLMMFGSSAAAASRAGWAARPVAIQPGPPDPHR